MPKMFGDDELRLGQIEHLTGGMADACFRIETHERRSASARSSKPLTVPWHVPPRRKSTVLRAIVSHRISATKTETGDWQIDASELFRVFPPVRNGEDRAADRAPVRGATAAERHETALFEAQIAALRETSELLRRQPFLEFFDLGELEPDEIPANIDDLLDEHAALIPRMILVLRKLARFRLENADAHRRPRKNKVGRNDPCPCGSGQKFKRCCGQG